MRRIVNKVIVELILGDITELATDAVVNAANEDLRLLAGGVAGAIRRRGGPAIQRECDDIGGTPVGTAVITTGGNLKARYVIHAVGPRWGEGDEDTKLAKTIESVLKLAASKKLRSIALPAISTGIFRFPKNRAAPIIVNTTVTYLKKMTTTLRRVVFSLFDPVSFELFQQALLAVT